MITEYRKYIDPSKVYIPLTDLDHKMANVKVEIGDRVLIGDMVAEKFIGKIKSPVLSTVSGKVLEFKDMIDRYGKIVDHIIIENDRLYEKKQFKTYKPNRAKENKEDTISIGIAPAEVRNVINELGLRTVSVDGMFTELVFNSSTKYVVVNAIFINEPFISTDYEFLIEHSNEIADGVDLISRAGNSEKTIILVDKFMPEDALEELGKAIVERDIEVVTIDSKKVDARDYKVIKKLVKEQLSINLLDNGVVYTTVSAAKMVHDAVRLGIPAVTRKIAITGDALKINAVYEVRIGTRFIDLVEDLGGYNEIKNMNLHIGSFLTGIQLDNDDFAITQSVDSINVAEYRGVDEDVCIKCGDCNDICPAGILPQNIMDAELRNVNYRIVDLFTHECVECGLCTYVCPSKINVLEWVRRAKRRVG
ncbi:MAG: Electron transport complex protein RnfC [Candidatus Izimaplasma bacterium HR2]|nr:MAG: Electron transport complex protein RnfC [Candidatus Izimaplasma bacterium HR2]